MKSVIALIVSLFLLNACNGAHSNVQPDVAGYSKQEQKQAAKEMLKFCDLTPMLCRMIVDFGVARDQARGR